MDKSADKKINTPDTGGNFEAKNFESVQTPNNIQTREKLRQILADQTLAPDIADAIRRQLALIESGKAPVVPNELSSGDKSNDKFKESHLNNQKAILTSMLHSDEKVEDWNAYADDVLNAAQRNKNSDLN